MGRVSASWRIFKYTLTFVKSEKKLLIYPVITFIIQLILLLVTLGVIALISYNVYEDLGGAAEISSNLDSVYSSTGNNSNQVIENYSKEVASKIFTTENNILIFIVLVLLFLMALVGNLFSIVVINSVFQKLKTNEINIKQAIKDALSNWFYIAQWTLFNFIVGMIINYIIKASERIPFLSMILSFILNAAWVTFTFFALPVLAAKKYNPFKTLKTSSSLIRKKFGVNILSISGLFIINLLWTLSLFGLGFLLLQDIQYNSLQSFLTQFNIVIFAAYFVFTLCLIILFSLIYKATLFMYCVNDTLPEALGSEVINGVISYKKKIRS